MKTETANTMEYLVPYDLHFTHEMSVKAGFMKPKGRTCRICGHALSRYNDGTRCFACKGRR